MGSGGNSGSPIHWRIGANYCVNQDKKNLPIAVDAMGADHGSAVVVEGAVEAASEYGISSIIVGSEEEISARLFALGAANHNLIRVHHAPEIVTMEDSPSAAIRRKPNSSIRHAFDLVKRGEASAVVSPGNTGAVMAAGMYVVGNLPGVLRPAIASLIPRKGGATQPTVLLDSGANVDCSSQQLVQFALMGAQYARAGLGVAQPKIGLLSNGTEDSKGTDVIRAAALVLGQNNELEGASLKYIGFVEPKHIPSDAADVVVADGFVGNCILKAMEGTVELVVDSLKLAAQESWLGSLGLMIAKPTLRRVFKDRLNPSAYGGAPLLGLGCVTIICHGSAKARAIKNGIKVAHTLVVTDSMAKMAEALAPLSKAEGERA